MVPGFYLHALTCIVAPSASHMDGSLSPVANSHALFWTWVVLSADLQQLVPLYLYQLLWKEGRCGSSSPPSYSANTPVTAVAIFPSFPGTTLPCAHTPRGLRIHLPCPRQPQLTPPERLERREETMKYRGRWPGTCPQNKGSIPTQPTLGFSRRGSVDSRDNSGRVDYPRSEPAISEGVPFPF